MRLGRDWPGSPHRFLLAQREEGLCGETLQKSSLTQEEMDTWTKSSSVDKKTAPQQ
jgi:hypothetical protein